MNYSEFNVWTDGGARGNPGPSAIGVLVCDEEKKEIKRYSKYIGSATNNVAEYKALLEALEILKEFQVRKVVFRLDSELVVKQLNGEYKVKDPNLKKLYEEITKILLGGDYLYSFLHVRRTENKIADCLVNEALDNRAHS